MTGSVNIGRLPVYVLNAPQMQERRRLSLWSKLADVAVKANGVYHVNGGAVWLPEGAAVSTLKSLGELWGCSKDIARRHLEAMEKAGAVRRFHPDAGAPASRLGGDLPVSRGTVIYLAGICPAFSSPYHRPFETGTKKDDTATREKTPPRVIRAGSVPSRVKENSFGQG